MLGGKSIVRKADFDNERGKSYNQKAQSSLLKGKKMTRVMIAGSEHLKKPEEIAALTEAFREIGVEVVEFPTNGGCSRFNWGDFTSALNGCSHMILVLRNVTDLTALVTSAQARMIPVKVGLIYLDEKPLKYNSWLTEEGRIDFVVANSPLLHSRVRGCSHTMWINNIERDAHEIANGFIGGNIKERRVAVEDRARV